MGKYNNVFRASDWRDWQYSYGDHGDYYYEIQMPCLKGANFRERAVKYLIKYYNLPFKIALAETVTSSIMLWGKSRPGTFDDFRLEEFIDSLSMKEAKFIQREVCERKIAEYERFKENEKYATPMLTSMSQPSISPIKMLNAIRKRFGG